MTKTLSLTDPAKEFAALCDLLNEPAQMRGDDFLARKLGVAVWSKEFYQLLFCISGRVDNLIGIVRTLDMDQDIADQAIQHIQATGAAFTREAMANSWAQNGRVALSRENVQAIKMLSPQVRQRVSYPLLGEEEREDLLGLVSELEQWLAAHQLSEQDFIRQAILDGLVQFQFRLERLGWLGWGYTLSSLKDVISAYLALEGVTTPDTAPDAAAVLLKVKGFIKTFSEKVSFAREFVDNADFLLRLYGIIALASQGTHSISGLLSSMSK